MKINLNLLKRLADRFGIMPLSSAQDGLKTLLSHPNVFIKAPANFEPLITGGGYQWDDELNGYRLGQNQKIFLLPNGVALWIFKDAVYRGLKPDSINKWVSADNEYPMGKANAFFIIYGKLMGQDLGQGAEAGDDIPDGEEEGDDGGGVAAPAEGEKPFTKPEIQQMLKGQFPTDNGGEDGGILPTSPIPPEQSSFLKPDEPEASAPMTGPTPNRLKAGASLPKSSEADAIITTLYKKAKLNPKDKLSKQHPIRIPYDDIIDLYNRAKTLPAKDKKKLIAFLKSGIVLPLGEGKIAKSELNELVRQIVKGIVREWTEIPKKTQNWTVKIKKEQSCAAGAGPTSGPLGNKKKQGTLEEMSTSSEAGPYSVPGAFAGSNLEKCKKHIEVLGYTLTPAGKKEMSKGGDALYENVNKTKQCQKCGQEIPYDKTKCPKCQFLQDDTPEEKKLKYGAAQLQESKDNITCPECGAEEGYVVSQGKKSGACNVEYKCASCGNEWGFDNWDAMDGK